MGADGRRRALMQRGDVRMVDLDPARRAEADKWPQVVIVSNDGAHRTAAVRSIAVERFGTRLGRIAPTLIVALDDALRLHLALRSAMQIRIA